MKKLPDPSSGHFTVRGVRLDRDEIEVLIALVREGHDGVFVVADQFEFDSIDELVEKRGTRPPRLKLGGTGPKGTYHTLSIDFDTHEAWVHGPTSKLYYQVREFLLSKPSALFYFMNPWLWGAAAWVCLTVFGTVGESAKKQQQPIPEWPVYLFFLSAALILLSYFYRRYALGVHLTRRHEGGFFTRNSDKIWLLILGAVLGVASTLLSQGLLR